MPRNPADRQLIRAINRSMVLNVIREDGPISKAAIARSTGLSQATVGAIVPSLINHGLVSESEPTVTGVGRPSTQLQLDRDSYNVIGLKLMEDRIVGAITDLEARTLGQSEIPLTSSTPDGVLESAASLIADLLDSSALRRDRLLGVGIGMAGVVATNEGVCHYSPFLDWRDVPIAEMAEHRLSLPVRVDNDVNTLALAERWFGKGQKLEDFLLVTLGRGVGLSIVAGGKVFRGARGGAGEFGHTAFGRNEDLCPCGRYGCLEATIGEPALLRRGTALATANGLPAPTTAHDLYSLAAHDDDMAEILSEAGRRLGRGLANLVNLFAPATVILSGEGVDAGEALFGSVQGELDGCVYKGLAGSFELIVEQLDDEAWARGAASLILDAVFEPPTQTGSPPLWGWDPSP